ncbi:hypothetical protein Tco_1125927 [Tanacetum coccineum]
MHCTHSDSEVPLTNEKTMDRSISYNPINLPTTLVYWFIVSIKASSYDQEIKTLRNEKSFKNLSPVPKGPNLSAQSDPLGHLHAELGILNTKIDQLESSISKKVAEDMRSSVPTIVADTLKSQQPGLLFDALKDTLPQLLKDTTIKRSAKSIVEEEFNAFNKLESQRFVLLQKELSKSLHNKMRTSIKLKIMFKDMVSVLKAAEVFKKENVDGEKWVKNNSESLAEEKDAQHPDETKGEQDSGGTTIAIIQGEQPLAQVVPNAGQAPLVNKEKALVLHNSEEKSSEEDTS